MYKKIHKKTGVLLASLALTFSSFSSIAAIKEENILTGKHHHDGDAG